MIYRLKCILMLLVVFILATGCRNSKTEEKTTLPVQNEVKAAIPESGISIHEASLNGQLSQVSGLLSGGTDVNKRDEDGRTALMYASYNGHNEVIKKLVESKADVNIQDNFGRTALMMAASGPYPATVKFLLDHQADPNLTDKEEHFTALMYASAEGQTDVVKILLSYRADPSLKDVDGDDALTFARNNGHQAVVLLLGSLK